MTKKWKFIAFDLGAESGRCFVAVIQHNKISLHPVHRFNTHTIAFRSSLHWNTALIFDEMITALCNVRNEFGSHFDGISVDTWGVDYVLLDRDGNNLSDPYHYRDSRTDGIMEEAFRILPGEKLYSISGSQSAQYNTLFQLLAERKNPSALLDNAASLLLMPDYFNYRLSGVRRAEYSIASTTNLCDPVKRAWSEELINTYNLPKGIFPEMVEPGCKIGTLLPQIAERTGLSSTIPVIASTGHDTASAVVSIPASGYEWAFLSSGTWSLMGKELKSPVLNADSFKYNFTNEGGYNRTTRFLKNITGLWPLQECRRNWKTEGKEFSYSELAALAKETGFTGCWIDLDDPRFLKPGEMPEKITGYLKETGQDFSSDPGFITAVILESLAFTYRKTLSRIEEVTRKKCEVLHVVGGGSQNELLTQYTADSTGVPVIAGPIEGAVVGNIGVQAITAGAVEDINSLREMIAQSFNVKKYIPLNTAYFNDNQDKYDKIIKTGEDN